MLNEPVRGSLTDPGLYTLPGIEQIRVFLRRLVPRPPLSHLVGYRLTQASPGNATVTMPTSPWLQAGPGIVEFTVLVEMALRGAVISTVPPATEVVTTALSMHRFRPVTVESESLIARARTLSTGATLTFAEALVEDALGRVVAHATAGMALRPMRPPPPPVPPLPAEPIEVPNYPSPDPYLRPLPDGVGPVPADVWDREDGLSLFRKVCSGDLPALPALTLFGARLLDADVGRGKAELPSSEWLCGVYRSVSAGALASVAMIVATGVVGTVSPPGGRIGVIDEGYEFLRTVDPDGRSLAVDAKVTHRHGDHILACVEVTDADGELVLVGHQGLLLLESGGQRRAVGRRQLLTIVFTDLVGSTRMAGDLGDGRWQHLLSEHEALVGRQLEIHKGRKVKATGDGVLATFESPARALEFALAIRNGLRPLGLEVRVGVHAGECELAGGDISGIAVNLAARIMGSADPGEILVSSTVQDLVAGSALRFADRGLHELRGIKGTRHLYALDG